jgi:hypothetical protein
VNRLSGNYLDFQVFDMLVLPLFECALPKYVGQSRISCSSEMAWINFRSTPTKLDSVPIVFDALKSLIDPDFQVVFSTEMGLMPVLCDCKASHFHWDWRNFFGRP